MSFRALVTEREASGEVASRVMDIDEARLPEGDVLVGIEWTGLNYKDALCLSGLGNLVRSYPHIAGIDLAGRVIASDSSAYRPGQAVVLTGWRVGELHWGGYAEKARLRSEWLVPLPETLSPRTAMMLGTAGLTAMLAIDRLERDGLSPERGEVLVTGASGGVGSLAVMLLSRLGYSVAAVTGRPENAAELERLGASRTIPRAELQQPTGKVLDKEQWSAAIDPAGGALLGEVLKKVRYGGAVASIGAAAGPSWDGNVIPFILRGVSLLGIDSVMQPYDARVRAWERLGELFEPDAYAPSLAEAPLEALPGLAAQMLKGQVAGRVIARPGEAGT